MTARGEQIADMVERAKGGTWPQFVALLLKSDPQDLTSALAQLFARHEDLAIRQAAHDRTTKQ